MGDAERKSQCQAPTRLQSQAPASIEIKRAPNWNMAIPLLSPLVSPSSCGNPGQEEALLMAENKAREEAKGLSFTKWQHPAAPFYYGPVPRATPFVPV